MSRDVDEDECAARKEVYTDGLNAQAQWSSSHKAAVVSVHVRVVDTTTAEESGTGLKSRPMSMPIFLFVGKWSTSCPITLFRGYYCGPM